MVMPRVHRYPARRARPLKPPDSRVIAAWLRDVRSAARRVRRLEQALETAASERDQVIRNALADGVPTGMVEEASELSRARLHQIRHTATPKETP